MVKKIVIGADHGGYRLKEAVKKYLDSKRIDYLDVGALKYEKDDDYPDFAVRAAQVAVRDKTLGILFCSTGIGMCIAANKIRGIRAASVTDVSGARIAKQKDDVNVLCLGAKYVSASNAKRVIGSWLSARFHGGRHKRRVNKIEYIEKHDKAFS
ncbi:MAG: RpiB/LacA/LacB family sugar-phosphate isomerase [Candidatus Woesearchaeota archaeon]